MAKIETELTCLHAQMKFTKMLADDKKKATEEMLAEIIKWMAAREEALGEKMSLVDEYALNVVRVLEGQLMELPDRGAQKPYVLPYF